MPRIWGREQDVFLPRSHGSLNALKENKQRLCGRRTNNAPLRCLEFGVRKNTFLPRSHGALNAWKACRVLPRLRVALLSGEKIRGFHKCEGSTRCCEGYGVVQGQAKPAARCACSPGPRNKIGGAMIVAWIGGLLPAPRSRIDGAVGRLRRRGPIGARWHCQAPADRRRYLCAGKAAA